RGLTAAAAYALGKVTVYTVAGALIIVLGLQLQAAAIPVVVTARKLLGPLMIVVGLVMLGWLPLRTRFGQRLAVRLAGRLPTAGLGGAFLLGVVFSLAFCPTLFWLFFGLTIPLALQAAAGWTFPGLFAVGTVVPLLGAAAAVSAGFGVAEALGGRMGRLQRVVGKVAGVIFILAGVNDTLTYWFL
ncbi:MAG: sulfite exporter TauE/SafE family protein, partial [Candidatus Rokubacteria bacterium]|nr:sulfite exporter TauE/SafE family protein [Candidatus Rokubacteria bacterium]